MTIDATYYSTQTTSGSGIPVRAGLSLCSFTGEYALPATNDLDTNDLLKMVPIPNGATVLDVIADIPTGGLDTGTSITWTVGDDGDEDRYITTQTVGQSSAGGIVRMNAAGGTYKYTADNTIDIKITAGAGTNTTTGTIKLTVIYTMDA
jgi:hypothetical protein